MTEFDIFNGYTDKNMETLSPVHKEFSEIREASLIIIESKGKISPDIVDSGFKLMDRPLENLDIDSLLMDMDEYIVQDNLFEKEMQIVENLSLKSNYSREKLIREIISFKSLDQSWDGYNALPLEVESALNAIKLIDFIGEKNFRKLQEIFPNPNGTVSFRWEDEYGATISLEVGNKTMSYYLEIEEGKPEFFNQIFINQEEGEKIAEVIERYF